VCDAEELSKDAAQLFEEGRQKMEQQKEAQKQKEAESLEEQRQERAKVHEAERLQNVAAECGAVWSFVFDSGRWYGLVGGAGFVGLVYPSGATAWRTVRENARIKKHVRGVYGRILEVRPGVNLEEFARRDLAHGFNGYSEIAKAWANTYAKTWEEFAAENAEELSKASKAQQEAENRAQELAKVAEATTAKDEQKKATEGTTEAKKEQKGNRPEVDTTAAPADGLQLVEISGGVAVTGDTRTTYRNRREIKAHGATWNKTAQRWEATEADKVAQLRAWFAQDEQTTEEAAEEATEQTTEAPQSTEPDTVGAGAAHYSACENSPIPEKSGTPSAPAFPDWCVFEFGDLDCNSYAPRWCTSFKTEDEARQWVENCANGTGAISPDAIDVLACAGGFWMVWHSKRNGGYYCQFVAQRASVGDLSGALLTADALNLRAKLFDLKRDHMARHEVATLEAMKAGELYAVEYEGESVTVEPDSANAGRFVATWWSRGAVQERHTDLAADQAARVVADFVCADIPATVWARERLLLRVLKVSELPYYSACENSPILQNVENSDLPALPTEERKKAATMTRRDLRAHWHPLYLGAYILAYAWATDRPFALMESAVIHAAQQEGTWQASDGWRISCEREQLEPYGSAYHLRYYSSTGELQEHVTLPLYQDAVKAACVFAFKHSESRTEQRAKKERPTA